MQSEIQNVVELITKLNNQALAATKEVTAINMRTVDKLVQQQLALVSEAVQGGVKQLELLREPKGVKEYLALQAELAQQGAEKTLVAAREAVAALNAARDELASVMQKGIEAVNAEVKGTPAAKKAA